MYLASILIAVTSATATLTIAKPCESILGSKAIADIGLYNGFFLENFTGQESDVQGRLAAGGDVDLSAGRYSIGHMLPSINACESNTPGEKLDEVTLVAGGKIHWSSGQNFYGHMVSGVNCTTCEYSPVPDTLIDPDLTGCTWGIRPSLLDFSGLHMGLKDLSRKLHDVTEPEVHRGEVDKTWQKVLTVSPSEHYVSANVITFHIDANDCETAEEIILDDRHLPDPSACSTDKPHPLLVFNIYGKDDVSFVSMGFSREIQDRRHRIIWNFVDASKLTMDEIGVFGTVLAPHAAIHGIKGIVHGQVIGKSWQGTMEINWLPLHCAGDCGGDNWPEDPDQHDGTGVTNTNTDTATTTETAYATATGTSENPRLYINGAEGHFSLLGLPTLVVTACVSFLLL